MPGLSPVYFEDCEEKKKSIYFLRNTKNKSQIHEMSVVTFSTNLRILSHKH